MTRFEKLNDNAPQRWTGDEVAALSRKVLFISRGRALVHVASSQEGSSDNIRYRFVWVCVDKGEPSTFGLNGLSVSYDADGLAKMLNPRNRRGEDPNKWDVSDVEIKYT